MVPLDQPLRERARVLLGAARDLLAVALHDVEDAHQTTSLIASSIATLASTSVSSCSRRRPRATSSRRRSSSRTTRSMASATSSAPAHSGSSNAAVADRLRDRGAGPGQHGHVEGHRLEQRHAESLVLAHGHERDRPPEHRREPGVVDRSDHVHVARG